MRYVCFTRESYSCIGLSVFHRSPKGPIQNSNSLAPPDPFWHLFACKSLCHLLQNRTQNGSFGRRWVFCNRLKMAVSSTPYLQPQIKVSQSPLRFSLSRSLFQFTVKNYAIRALTWFGFGFWILQALRPRFTPDWSFNLLVSLHSFPSHDAISSVCPLLICMIFHFKVRLEEGNLILLLNFMEKFIRVYNPGNCSSN